ncbi:MAG: hypothetical protein Q7T03_07860 [Deltaproteobacteria bacterium]|nr:hypothetical protein [Deltaproteobacteria bacterium]
MMRHFYFWFAILLIISSGFAVSADISGPETSRALSVIVAHKAMDEAMAAIAKDIGALEGEFPQLKKWRKATVSAKEIIYQYHYSEEEGFEKNGCNLRIYSKDQPDLGELKVGIYLKMKATGERAETLKQMLQKIVGNRFESIRALRFAHAVE